MSCDRLASGRVVDNEQQINNKIFGGEFIQAKVLYGSLTEAQVPPAQKSYYEELFQLADIDRDHVIGPGDASFFRKSSLADETLKDIWNLADVKDGYLDLEDFIVALKLISLTQLGAPVTLDSIKAMPVVPPPKLLDVPPIKFDWIVPQSEKNNYVEIFNKNDDDSDGYISGQQARSLFSSSGLPMKILGHIWYLSDMNADQRLDCQEFIIATFLIRSVLKGYDLPSKLPDQLIQSSHYVSSVGVPSPKVPDWLIPPAERIINEDIFNKNQQNGAISGKQAKVIFEKSGLPVQDLKVIWDLSDYDQAQWLDKQKFVIAMFLISQRKKKKEFPTSLPQILIESSKSSYLPISPPPIVEQSNDNKTSSGKYNIDLADIVSKTEPVMGGGMPSPVSQQQPQEFMNNNNSILPVVDQQPNPLRTSLTIPPPPSASTQHQQQQFYNNQGMVGSGSGSVSKQSPIQQHHQQQQIHSMSAPITPQQQQVYMQSPAQVQAKEAIERVKQATLEKEKSLADLKQQFIEESKATLELQQQLAAETQILEEVSADMRQCEDNLQLQKQETMAVKEKISSVRVEIKMNKSQLEQVKKLLSEKTEQFEEQNESLSSLQNDLQEKKADLEKYNQEVEKLIAQIESIKSLKSDSKGELKQVNSALTSAKGQVSQLTDEFKQLKTQANIQSPPPQQHHVVSPTKQQPTSPFDDNDNENPFSSKDNNDEWGSFETVSFNNSNNNNNNNVQQQQQQQQQQQTTNVVTSPTNLTSPTSVFSSSKNMFDTPPQTNKNPQRTASNNQLTGSSTSSFKATTFDSTSNLKGSTSSYQSAMFDNVSTSGPFEEKFNNSTFGGGDEFGSFGVSNEQPFNPSMVATNASGTNSSSSSSNNIAAVAAVGKNPFTSAAIDDNASNGSASNKAEIGSTDFSFTTDTSVSSSTTALSAVSAAPVTIAQSSPTTTLASAISSSLSAITFEKDKDSGFDTFDSFSGAKDPFGSSIFPTTFSSATFFGQFTTSLNSQDNQNQQHQQPQTITSPPSFDEPANNQKPFGDDDNDGFSDFKPDQQPQPQPITAAEPNPNGGGGFDGFDDSFDDWNPGAPSKFNTTFNNSPFGGGGENEPITSENLFGQPSAVPVNNGNGNGENNGNENGGGNGTTQPSSFFFDDNAFTEKFDSSF
ncbi:EPS15 domain-containing protein [Cavenderia fasciculata]|uniref:EPS15 domain-containing protein n=2 Tax=Cavenderia fasciculata TaxID=261658 RepID=F4Q4T9_CACFS|nr:EPS15 domain-containing protein [Cavenderia fasciculata]EGG17885.1 EPS15 domain-containing protein [Cavenderia fasciculata]|eukprot:XP_004356369.1 EPS15 domain-containing protein [Cavenderia fasciculata]